MIRVSRVQQCFGWPHSCSSCVCGALNDVDSSLQSSTQRGAMHVHLQEAAGLDWQRGQAASLEWQVCLAALVNMGSASLGCVLAVFCVSAAA
jgi:hypothetical protein